MKIFDKNSGFESIIEVDEDDLKDAKLSAVDFAAENVKKRAFVNVLGARLAMKMLFSQKIKANNLYSLYTIQNILEELNISDIYVDGIRIDVRLVFDRNEIFIPKSHFEYDLLPDIYLVLELQKDFSSAQALGFFEPKSLDKQNASKDFYFYEYDKLTAPEEIKEFLDNYVVERNFDITENNQKAEELLLSLIDKEISSDDKHFLFKHLANDVELREKAVEFENFELISKQVAKGDALLNGQVLEIVGAQKLYNEDEPVDELGELGKDEVKKDPPGGDTVAAGAIAGAVAGVIAGAGAAAATSAITASVAGVSEAAALGVTAKDLADAALSAVAAGSGLDILPEIEKEEDLFEIDENAVEVEEKNLENLDSEVSEILEEEPEILEDLEIKEEEPEIEENTPEVAEEIEEEMPEIEEETPREVANLEDEIEEDLDAAQVLPEIEEDDDLGELEELTPLEDLETADGALPIDDEEEPEVEKEDSDDVIDLEDFDFDILNEKTGEQEDSETESDFNAVSFDEIIEQEKGFDAEKIASDVVDESQETLQEEDKSEKEEIKEEYLEEDDEEESGEKFEKGEDTDDFLSQVDDFLNNDFLAGVEFDEEQQKILEENPEMNQEPKSQTAGAFNYADMELQEDDEPDMAKKDNETLQVLFQNGNVNGEQFASEGELDVGENSPLLYSKPTGGKNKKIMIAASLAGVVLISIVAGNAFKPKSNDLNLNTNAPPISASGDNLAQSAPSELTQEEAQDGIQSDFQNNDLDAPAKPVGKAAEAQQPRDMNKAVSDIFLSEPVNTTISKVGWEVPEDLAYNDSFRKYLQMAGRNLKLNLQNNLLLATEMAYSNKVVVDLTIGRGGELRSSNVSVSSGSKQIDNIVLQSVKETLKYLKVPSSEINGDSFAATLIINF